ncbi:hypothetical protein LTR70_006287 [Exophiala xenobiotica]|uniref:WIF domain-containing protein n=1 Tax=Lithohypha guttulata TaxID=1690604 RepID=A0ABR0KHT7_9EURO|nr:hypothetical protein LTR24_002397 [Lithohypha guttulata]KAK5316333.1 hypothetical protein LTR70_006287 [Exophiala xenobiotica]
MPLNTTNELKDSVDAPVTYTHRLLSQFENASVSPYTVNYSRIAHTKYKASTGGERTFNSCLTNLPVYVATDDHLQFGWNERSIWRNIELHLYEYEHLLLIAAIVECLPESYAGAVLSCLADPYEDEQRPNPSLTSWADMARSLDGVLSTSDFALVVDDRMRLDPYRATSGHSATCTNSMIAPMDFAKALQALGSLSDAGSGHLTLVGGDFLGWFCAFAELFLDVNVQVVSKDGEVLYATHTSSKALLHLIFMDDSENLDSTIQAQDQKSLTLRVMSGPDTKAIDIPRVPFTGRSGWEALLPKVFESSFHRIAHEHSKFLVQSIGGVARLLQFIVEDPNTPEEFVSKENRYNSASYGVGLIETICNWFPELRHLQGRMERLQKLSDHSTIGEKCDAGATGFASICGCTICALVPYHATTDPGTLPQSFCPLAIMETIVNMGLAMSRITVVSKLYPSRAGVLSLYQRQVQKLLSSKKAIATMPNCDTMTRINTLFLRDWNANYSVRLQTAVALFSGSWPEHDLHDNLIALSHEGICAYVLGVQYGDEKSARRKDADVIRVQPGHIAWKQKIYSRACLGSPVRISRLDFTWQAARCSHISKELHLK